MAGPGETNDLDFSSLLVPMTVDVAPLAETEEVQAHALIGAAEIKHGGFCVSLTRDRPKPRAAAPQRRRMRASWWWMTNRLPPPCCCGC